MRADQLLVERGLAVSRSQAARLIAAGLRWFDGAGWRLALKSRVDIPLHAPLALVDTAEARYVSRGGLKLEGALALTEIKVCQSRCLDVGQSTGGFSDCLLQHGAAEVVGIDVGHSQLHSKLRADARVKAFEGVNARHLRAADLLDAWPACGFDLIVGDLSFISLTLVLPALVPLLSVHRKSMSMTSEAASGGDLLLLVKPQFELQPTQIGKGGIVRDACAYAIVEQRLRRACTALGLRVLRWFESPIVGGDGNREFFIHAIHAEGPSGASRASSDQF